MRKDSLESLLPCNKTVSSLHKLIHKVLEGLHEKGRGVLTSLEENGVFEASVAYC